jgi:hypothetical protein
VKINISKDWIMDKASQENGQSIEAGQPTPTREQWLARCAARFASVAAIEEPGATELAEIQLENLKGDLTENPEEAADDEMSYWTAD